jgi:hypothetical protein
MVWRGTTRPRLNQPNDNRHKSSASSRVCAAVTERLQAALPDIRVAGPLISSPLGTSVNGTKPNTTKTQTGQAWPHWIQFRLAPSSDWVMRVPVDVSRIGKAFSVERRAMIDGIEALEKRRKLKALLVELTRETPDSKSATFGTRTCVRLVSAIPPCHHC